MIPLENLKFRIVGKVLKDLDYKNDDSESHFLKDAYVFSRGDGKYYCCLATLEPEELNKLIEDKYLDDFRNAEGEYISIDIFHDYTVMDVYPATCFEYWEERGLNKADIDGAIDLLMITMNSTVGTYELSVQDFNFFLFGVLLGKSPMVFDGVKDKVELRELLDLLFCRNEAMIINRKRYLEKLKEKQTSNTKPVE